MAKHFGPLRSVMIGRMGTAVLQVAQFAPAILSVNLGQLQALAQNADGSLVAAASFLPGLPAHPATAGDTITVWMTGLGPVTTGTTGQTAPDSSQQATTQPVVFIGGIPAQVTSAGLSTQYVGVNQVTAFVPTGTPTGSSVPVQVQVNGITGPDPVVLAIQPPPQMVSN